MDRRVAVALRCMMAGPRGRGLCTSPAAGCAIEPGQPQTYDTASPVRACVGDASVLGHPVGMEHAPNRKEWAKRKHPCILLVARAIRREGVPPVARRR